MEQIIILAVIGILSTLFSKKGKSGPDKEAPRQSEQAPRPAPVRQQRAEPAGQTDPFKRLKELTGDLYRELQEEQQPAPQPKPSRPEVVLQPPKAETPVQRKTEMPARHSQRDTQKRTGRLSAHNPGPLPEAQPAPVLLDMKDEQDILKGIIFSEILGPPKSKR